MEDKDANTIPEFCRRHGFSVSHYFNEARKGRGPRVMHVGNRVLISKEAQADWRRQREEEGPRPSPAEVPEVLAHNPNLEGVRDSVFGDRATSKTVLRSNQEDNNE